MKTALNSEGFIPRHYFCNWTIGLDLNSEYEITVERRNVSEYNEYVFLYQKSSQFGDTVIFDEELRDPTFENTYTIPITGNEYVTIYVLVDQKLYSSPYTITINTKAEPEPESVITLGVLIIICSCVLFFCFFLFCIIRLFMKRRQMPS